MDQPLRLLEFRNFAVMTGDDVLAETVRLLLVDFYYRQRITAAVLGAQRPQMESRAPTEPGQGERREGNRLP